MFTKSLNPPRDWNKDQLESLSFPFSLSTQVTHSSPILKLCLKQKINIEPGETNQHVARLQGSRPDTLPSLITSSTLRRLPDVGEGWRGGKNGGRGDGMENSATNEWCGESEPSFIMYIMDSWIRERFSSLLFVAVPGTARGGNFNFPYCWYFHTVN